MTLLVDHQVPDTEYLPMVLIFKVCFDMLVNTKMMKMMRMFPLFAFITYRIRTYSSRCILKYYTNIYILSSILLQNSMYI